MRRAPSLVLGLLLCASLASSPSRSDELKDLYFGEALYYAHQGYYFDALERLDTEVRQHGDLDEPELDTLYFHINDAEFSLGDFELRYRMHHRAGRAITAVLEGSVDEIVRNDAAYRLARIHFQKSQMDDALRALERIDGKVPEGIRDDIEFLRANLDRSDVSVAEKFRQVLEAYKIENEYGRKIDAYKGSVEIDGTERDVNFFRVGRIALLYQTTDTEISGAWDQASRSWVPLDRGEFRNAIMKGLRIARKEASIDLMNLPVAAPEAN